ncbi:hypothetical protein [Sphingopyxis fribergensis]
MTSNRWTEKIKSALKLFAIAFALLLLWKCSPFNSIFDEHEKACRLHAKTIVHNQDLWAIYMKGGDEAFQDRKREFPETERAVGEYVPGFEHRFGRALTIGRNPRIGEVVRDDLVIVKDGILVARFVDFAGSYNSIEGPQFLTCLGNYKSNYDRISIDHQ